MIILIFLVIGIAFLLLFRLNNKELDEDEKIQAFQKIKNALEDDQILAAYEFLMWKNESGYYYFRDTKNNTLEKLETLGQLLSRMDDTCDIRDWRIT